AEGRVGPHPLAPLPSGEGGRRRWWRRKGAVGGWSPFAPRWRSGRRLPRLWFVVVESHLGRVSVRRSAGSARARALKGSSRPWIGSKSALATIPESPLPAFWFERRPRRGNDR